MSDEKTEMPGNKKLMLGVGAVGIAFVIWNGLTSGSSSESTQEQTPARIEVASDPVNAITLQDKDAALTQFAKKIESLEQKIATSEVIKTEEKEKTRRAVEAQQQATNNELRSLSEEIALLRKDGIDKTYAGINSADKKNGGIPGDLPSDLPALGTDLDASGGLNFGDLEFNMSAPSPPSIKHANPYGPNYFILRPQVVNPVVSKNGGAPDNASENDLFAAMNAPVPQDYSFNAEMQRAQQGENPNAPASAYDQMASNPQNGQQGLTSTVQAPAPELEVIPAFSFVEVTPLHGVACPVGANSPGDSSEAKIPARPVVLPVRGIFRGPNGVSKDVGTIHLMGLCSGRRTSSSTSGRATIRVEQMSYWDAAGGAQMVAATGYIVDTRDNEQDVYGRMDKTSGRTLALQAMAAAAAAYSTTLSQAEFTTQNSLTSEGNSNTTSQLTGDSTKAAVSQGIAQLFNKIGARFEAEANAAVDTVIVEPGVKLRFVTDQPISVVKPAEPFDIDAKNYDILL